MTRFLAAMATVAIMAGALLAASALHAEDPAAGPIKITEPWVRPTIGNAPISAAYLTITNQASDDDLLVSVAVEAAKKVELHNVITEGDITKMRKIEGGIAIPAGQTVVLKPGTMHIMLMGLDGKLKDGDKLDLVLTFAKAGELALSAPVGMMDQAASGQHNATAHETAKAKPKKRRKKRRRRRKKRGSH